MESFVTFINPIFIFNEEENSSRGSDDILEDEKNEEIESVTLEIGSFSRLIGCEACEH
jgi:hypothetical protein